MAETAAFYATGSTAPTATFVTEIKNGTSGNINDVTYTAGDISITNEHHNSSSNSQVNGNLLRWYKDDIFNVTIPAGATVTKITLEGVGSSYQTATASVKIGDTSSDFTTGSATRTWTGEATTDFSITNGGQIRFSSITFEYTPAVAKAVAAPTFDLVEGTEGFSVTIACETEGAEIYYAYSDESADAVGEPTTKYTGPVEVWGKTYFKAVAKLGEDTSYEISYVANPPMILDGLGALSDAADFAGTEIIVKCPMTVVDYVEKNSNQRYLYITDGTYNMLVYNPGQTFTSGDKFSRLEATIAIYGGNVQLQSATFGEITTGGEAVAPTEAETLDFVEAYNLYGYYKIENVSITNISGSNATITDAEGTEKALYNQYGIDIEEGQKYTVTGFVGKYNDSVQFQPTLIEGGEIIVAAPVFEIEDGSDIAPQQVIPVTAEEGATIYYSYNDEDEWNEVTEALPIYAIGLVGDDLTIHAYAEKEGVKSETVSVTYHISQIKTDAEIAWVLENADGDFEAVTEFTYVLGETGTLPFLMIMSDDYSVTSDNEAVAYFDESEWSLVIGEVGTATVTASVPETTTNKAGEAVLTITVKEKSDAISCVVDFSNQSWTAYSKTALNQTWVANDGTEFATTFSMTGSTYTKILNSSQLQIYASNGNKITVSAPADYGFVALSMIVDESNKDAGAIPQIDGVECVKAESDSSTEVEYVHAFTGTEVTSFELTGNTGTNNSNGKQIRISTITLDIVPTHTAIENVTVDDENAPVEYFNLQGVRVANPENGLYIRRQGSKATKVIIR